MDIVSINIRSNWVRRCSSFIIMTMIWADKSINLGWILGSDREFLFSKATKIALWENTAFYTMDVSPSN